MGVQEMTEDKIDTLSRRLRHVVDKFEELQACGVSQDILVTYLHAKTGLSYRDVKNLLANYEEFHRTLINKAVVDKMEKNE